MTDSRPPLRIAVADDHPIFRDGLCRLLEAELDMEVVAEAADAQEALELTVRLKPDILLLDLAMPRMSGLDALTALANDTIHRDGVTRVILLTAAIGQTDIVTALQLGARGLVLKESATALLMYAIRAVMEGDFWVGRERVPDLVTALRTVGTEVSSREGNLGLTPRELQIVALVVSATGNREIAQKLGITEKTVKHHLTNIFDKLGVSSRLELALFAINQNVKFHGSR